MEIELKPRSREYLDDPACLFLRGMDKHPAEREQLALREIEGRVTRVRNKLRELERAEVEEWRAVQENKVRQLSKRVSAEPVKGEGNARLGVATRALKQHLRILIYTCNEMQMPYNTPQVTQLMKQLYFDQYGEQIFPSFLKAGLSTHEFQSLSYPSPLLTFCCCWQQSE